MILIGGGYYNVAERSGILSTIFSLSMLLVPGTYAMAGWVIEHALNRAVNAFEMTRNAKAQTLAKYYYRNKIGQVYNHTVWKPWVQIGQRRGFEWCWGTTQRSSAEAPQLVQGDPKQENSQTNPTNYNGIQKKAHYDDDSWIVNRAIQSEDTGDGGYVDIFTSVFNPL